MRKLLVLLLLGMCCWLGAANTLQAAENPYSAAGIENPAEFEKAFKALQTALAAGDRGKVADAVLLPLRVNGWVDENQVKVVRLFTSRQEVIENYADIFTPKIKEAIVRQKVSALFVNWQGVMVGNGEAWLSISEKTPVRYGMISINLGL